jgi:hypothetical protein
MVSVFLLFATLALCQPNSSNSNKGSVTVTGCSASDEAALRRISEVWKEGYNSGNAGKVAALYTPDAYYLTQHFVTGIVHPRGRIQAYVQRGVDAHYHLDVIEILKLECSADLAYTVGHYESTNGGQKAMGVNVVVLRKIKGQWLIVAHESAVPDPVTAVQDLDLP